MAGKEYKAREKVVSKMTNEGLAEENLLDHSMENISQNSRDRPKTSSAEFVLERERKRTVEEPTKKKQNQPGHTSHRKAGLETNADHKKMIKKRQMKKRLTFEQAKAGRLNFGDERNQMIQGIGLGVAKKSENTVTMSLQGNDQESEEDVSRQEVQTGKQLATESARKMYQRNYRAEQKRNQTRKESKRFRNQTSRRGKAFQEIKGSRLRFETGEPQTERIASVDAIRKKEAQRVQRNRFFQKRRYKEMYKARRAGIRVSGNLETAITGMSTEGIGTKAKIRLQQIIRQNRAVWVSLGIFALMIMVITVSLGSCTASIQGGGSLIGITTYPSTDADIYAAENAYAALEDALNEQINNMESKHPGYDDYNYNVDEISHNPYHLISYLTAKYGDWTYDDIKDEIKDLFAAQYRLTTHGETKTVTETKTIRVGASLGKVVTSGYCNCVLCNGQWAGGPTASGKYPKGNHTLAVDAKNPFVPLGTKVVMNGIEYTVEDTGNFAKYGVAFDVYYDDHATAEAHGHKTWEAFLADDNGKNEVTVTVTSTKKIFYTTLGNHGFDFVAKANLNAEQMILYDALNTTYGNRNYLWDVKTISAGAGGMSYDIPPEALTDERFKRMIREAEKYLGYPYVWGGSSPSTSFDCSGFVSWVINHSGNGWNYGRRTAEGLRGLCTYVSPAEAKPGDLIFFEKTYKTSGASHVGIYVGNGMMIHCGNPIQYASINTPYWKKHFMCFGRLP